MTQTDLFIAMPSPFKPGSQNDRVYRRLARWGRVKNFEIQYGLGGPKIMKYTNRVSEVRAYLEPHGITIHCERVGETGVFEYEVR